MKYISLLLVIFIFSNGINAQDVDFNRVIIPASINPEDFGEKLVQLAWRNHPSVKIADNNLNYAVMAKSRVNWDWLNNIYAVGNINEFTINPDPLNRQLFFPRYNFGVRVTLGMFTEIPLKNAQAKEEIDISMHNIDMLKLETRKETLNRFEDFKKWYRIVQIRIRLEEDRLQMFEDFESKFILGEVDLEKLSASNQLYNASIESRIQGEADLQKAVNNLEEMIGVKLEEVDGFDVVVRELIAGIR